MRWANDFQRTAMDKRRRSSVSPTRSRQDADSRNLPLVSGGEQAQILQHLVAQVMSLTDDQHRALFGPSRVGTR